MAVSTNSSLFKMIKFKFTLRAQGSECSDTIRRSWAAVDNLTASDSGLDWLSKEFRLCKNIKKVEAVQLKGYLNEVRGIYCKSRMRNMCLARKNGLDV